MFTSRMMMLSFRAWRFAKRSLATNVFLGTESVPSSTPRIYGSALSVSVLVAAAAAGISVQNTSSSSATASLEEEEEEEPSKTTLLNWSGTHSVQISNDRYWEPESVAEVEEIVRICHERNQPVRPLGSALSPNGIAFHEAGMISMAHLDQIVAVDRVERTVTVQAGARVSQVVEALRPYQLTLPNLASIAEQQMGGFVQVGAHGTGRCIAPVDHYVTQLKLVTPSQGTLTLTEVDGELFHMAKVGLGCLGVVVEVTMQCIPAHYLREHTFVLTRQQAREQLETLLKEHKHMRYMWIPYTDAVVCVTNDPVEGGFFRMPEQHHGKFSDDGRLRPLTDLLIQATAGSNEPFTHQSVQNMGFGELRDALLAINPLDINHVQRCNEAEAEFWKKSEGYTVKPSDELLQFDCGGQQWVWEVCFPTGTQNQDNGNDMLFMERLLAGIEKHSIPAHSPIEQRWSASSSSLMSPANGAPEGLHSWVGIISYLPSENERQRREITELFTGPYCDLLRNVGTEMNATSHWAKLERPASMWKLIDLQLFLDTRFPLSKFNAWRSKLDPKNILSSPTVDLLLGKPEPKV